MRIVVLCCLTLYSAVHAIPAHEIEALRSLYTSTSGATWTWDEGEAWDFESENADPCVDNWHGVFCHENITIVGLDLWTTNLNGYIPENISLLGNLTMLDLGNNHLTSTLPSALGTLTALDRMNMIYNYLTGSIPSTFQNLTLLEYLSLESNELTGTIPVPLSKLAHLIVLSLRLNHLTGSVPTSFTDAMTGLETFNIACNSFTGTLPLFTSQSKLHKIALNENRFSGTIPASYFTNFVLIAIELSMNYLTGQLPGTLCNASSMVILSLNDNMLSGEMVRCSFDAMNLKIGLFSRNSLYGILSSDVMNLRFLEQLTVDSNLFSSQLPSLDNMSQQCKYLNFAENIFTGTMPDHPSYSFFVAANNILSGSIPSSYFNSTLSLLDLSANIITGTISDNVAGDTDYFMRVLMLSSNFLSGTIPHQLMNMTTLSIVTLAHNILSGSLPLFSFQGELKSFIVTNNFLSDQVPQMISSNYLENLNLGSNYFTGAIPSDFNSGNLNYLSLNSNFFDGSLPLTVFYSWLLEFLDCSRNFLSGTLPSSIYSAYALLNLNLHSNLLAGPLPTRYGPNLVAVMYSDNKFTGTLPKSLSDLNMLSVVKVQGNHLTGSLEKVFSNNNVEMLSVDLSDNRFSGSLPTQLFELPNIQSVALVKNCFHGKISDSICASDTLQILALDGLASACKQRLWDPLALFGDNYITDDTFGSIPTCVWGMPALTTLHLSGNGLTGNIESARLHDSSNLTSLSLSHNRLTGTIPSNIRDRLLLFNEFDVSHNRFAGIFSNIGESSSHSNAFLSLEVNRFSGHVSSKFNDFDNVKVLSGNLFQCSKQSDLPSNDPDAEVYICGSGELDSSMYSLVAAFLLMILCIWYVIFRRQSGASMFDWSYARIMNPALGVIQSICVDFRVKVEDVLQMKYVIGSMMHSYGGLVSDELTAVREIAIFNGTLRHILHVGVSIATCILLIVLPCIIIIKRLDGDIYSKSQMYQYGWEISAAYMSGMSAAILLAVLWVSLVGFCVAMIYARHLALRSATGGKVAQEPLYVEMLRKVNPSAVLDYGSVILLNMIVVFVVNGAYIYIQLKDVSQGVQIFSQVSLAGFKLVWDTFAVGAAISWISSRRKDNLDDRTLLYTALLVFNNIIAPCFVTAVTDDTCFKGLFEEADTVTVEYENTKCMQYSIEHDTLKPYCSAYVNQVFQTSYQPIFTYNYQCSSAILKSFVPVFIYAYAFMILVLPIMDVAICYETSTILPQFIRKNLAGVMWPRQASEPNKPLIRVDRVMSTLMRHLAVLLTFGFAYPLLGVGVVIAMIQYTWKWRLLIVRYVATISMLGTCDVASDTKRELPGVDVDVLVSKLSSDCRGSWRGAYICLWAVIWPGALFIGCLVFDILGDEVGWKDAIWLFAAILLFPLACRGGLKIWTYVVSHKIRDEQVLDVTTSPVLSGPNLASSVHDNL